MFSHYNQDAPCMESSPTFGLQFIANVGEYCIPLGPKTMKNKINKVFIPRNMGYNSYNT